MKQIILAAFATTAIFAGTAQAAPVEVYLTDMLDNIQSGYCLDIAGAKGADANPDKGLQGHTCYSPLGSLGVDQIFESEQFADGILYMPEFDVCAEVASDQAGASVNLTACNGSDAQSFTFAGEGKISPASAPEVCLTLAEGTRTGRSDTNQIKVLTLELCTDALSAFQNWAVRSE